MNEYNHHRIIERFASAVKLDDAKKQILKKASNFTDSVKAKEEYFFYRNYYDIDLKGNTIQLTRIKDNGYWSNHSISSMEKAGEKLLSGKYLLDNWKTDSNEKEFFSSVNNRKKSPHFDVFDTGNQSDNVAFLHAMGAAGESLDDSREEFEKHIKKCFAEYLFLENEDDALFVLGIAFHGIMDSFTPSHTGFQEYSKQSMALHAQGDVIPIKGQFDEAEDTWILKSQTDNKIEAIKFVPGQFDKDDKKTKMLDMIVKGFDGGDTINDFEWEMLKILLIIGDIKEKTKGGKRVTIDSSGKVSEDNTKRFMNAYFVENGKRKTRTEIEFFLEQNYEYGETSYYYSEKAISVLKEIYNKLSSCRNSINNYNEYKKEKEKKNESTINEALNIWKKAYNDMHNKEEDAFGAKHALLRKLFYQKDKKDKYTTPIKKKIDSGQVPIELLNAATRMGITSPAFIQLLFAFNSTLG